MQLIINADDCGRTKEVDLAIEQSILSGKITSTTIMANMEDVETAINLYNKYNEQISFGCHLNLTAGTPMLYNQELLDFGYYRYHNGRVEFDGSKYRNQILPSRIREGVFRELCAQIERLLDDSVAITHIDSHHHMHTSLSMLPILPRIISKYGIRKVRRVRNFVPGAMKRIPRTLWPFLWQRSFSEPIAFTDYFADMWDFSNRKNNGINTHNKVVELMCHPGGTNQVECELFDSQLLDNDIELVNYKSLSLH
jgi:predicted glycoside hydrolase/deacetylase ChbG (UPF0249 family)